MSQYHREDILSCNGVIFWWCFTYKQFTDKTQNSFCFLEHYLCVSASSSWCSSLEIWVWKQHHNCSVIITWVSGKVGTSFTGPYGFNTSVLFLLHILSIRILIYSFLFMLHCSVSEFCKFSSIFSQFLHLLIYLIWLIDLKMFTRAYNFKINKITRIFIIY